MEYFRVCRNFLFLSLANFDREHFETVSASQTWHRWEAQECSPDQNGTKMGFGT